MQRSSLNLSFGELDTESGQVALHMVSKRQSGAQFADIPLVTKADGTIIRLGDVAEIRDAFAPDDRVVLTVNDIPALLVTVGVADWQSLTDVAAEVREWLAAYSPPPEVTVSVWDDTAGLAVKRMRTILRNVVIGVVLVFVLLILVLDLRVAVWVALGIPLAFVGSLTLIAPLGLTINVVTISAFFLVVGLVVDDALIVGREHRHRTRRQSAAAAGCRHSGRPGGPRPGHRGRGHHRHGFPAVAVRGGLDPGPEGVAAGPDLRPLIPDCGSRRMVTAGRSAGCSPRQP